MKSRIFLGFIVIALIGLGGRVPDVLAQEVSAVIFLEKSEDAESGVEEVNGEFRVPRNRLVKILVAVSTQAAINVNIEIEATSGGSSAQLDLSCTGNGSQASCSGLSIATDTTFEVSFFASQLVEKLVLNQDKQMVTLKVSVLGVVGTQVAPLSGGDRELSLTLDEAVVDLGLEGPVILTPVLPQQGDIVTLSFFVRNNDPINAGSFSALTFNLQRPDGQIIDMTLLLVECVVESILCSQGGEVAKDERKVVTVRFATSTLAPTRDGEAYRVLINLKSARDDILDNNAFAVSFSLGEPESSGPMPAPLVTLTLEGPVTLAPLLPRQGDIITLSLFVRNNDPSNTVPLGALDFNLRRPDGLVLDTILLLIECLVENIPCAQGGDIPASGRKVVTVRFVTSLLAPTGDNETYRILIGLPARDDILVDSDGFAVSFQLGEPIRDFSVTIQSPGPGFQVNAEQEEVAVRFTARNNTSLLLRGNVIVFDLKIQTPTEDPGVFQFVELPFDSPVLRCGVPEIFEKPDSEVEPRCEFDANPVQQQEFEVRFDSRSLPSGTYQLTVQVAQKDGSIPVTDNLARILFELLAPILPDDEDPPQSPPRGPELRPIAFKFVPSTTAGQGAKVLLATTIKNSGNREARDIVVSFSLKREGSLDPFVHIGFVQRFPRLGVGLSLKVSQILDVDGLGLEPGVYRIRVSVKVNDPNTQELDPQNNTLEGLITVKANADE